jgi:hypothetical protein
MFALVTGVVFAPVRRLLMAPLGFPALLAAGCLATVTRAVAVAAVAATADGERPLAVPAMAKVKNAANLARWHQASRHRVLDNRGPSMRGYQRVCWASAPCQAGRGTT